VFVIGHLDVAAFESIPSAPVDPTAGHLRRGLAPA
jgi:hypothetical protein